jgi:hypothetical protein
VRSIYLGVYFAAGILAIALGAGTATALVSALVAGAVVGVLEFWFRRRHAVRAADK